MGIFGEGRVAEEQRLVLDLHGFEGLEKRAELEVQEHESESPVAYVYKYVNLKLLEVTLDRIDIILRIYGELWIITRGLEYSLSSKPPQNQKERCGI